jgi:hypothetical protein
MAIDPLPNNILTGTVGTRIWVEVLLVKTENPKEILGREIPGSRNGDYKEQCLLLCEAV